MATGKIERPMASHLIALSGVYTFSAGQTVITNSFFTASTTVLVMAQGSALNAVIYGAVAANGSCTISAWNAITQSGISGDLNIQLLAYK